MASTLDVWFVLVDGKGKKRTTARSVDVSRSHSIDRFRKALKLVYANSHLKEIPPSDLRVYANKAAFDTENPVPLRSSAALTGLGTDKDNALLVVVPEDQKSKASAAKPFPTKPKITQLDVVCQGPVGVAFYSVPMEMIPVYGKLSDLFSTLNSQLCLLYGPRQFGKTTIGYRIRDLLAADASVLVIYHSITEYSVTSEEEFWTALGSLCGEVTSTPHDVMDIVIRRKQRLFLILDEMEGMFANAELTSNFLDVLREWSTSPFFRGFLGIGSYDLMSLYKFRKGNDRVSPFNLCAIFKVDRFSTDQMIAFFKLIEPRYSFHDSTRIGIMEYSGGAPGVFGSLIRFSIDNVKWNFERHEWETWFKITKFDEYLEKYNWTYSRIQDDLKKMPAKSWEALQSLVMNGVSIHCSLDGADDLLRMGIVIEGKDSSVGFSSEMMRRVCMEALSIRDVGKVDWR